MPEQSQVSARRWDVIVIGTGMGGATLGYALAKAGKRVLFCERGRSNWSRPDALRGDYAEQFFPGMEAPQPKHHDFLARAGRCWEEVEDCSRPRPIRFIPFIGAGSGGSSALYGMALERLFPGDFSPRQNFPDAQEAALPECWPISYADLKPYYGAAERLYRVRGEQDPLRAQEMRQALPAPPPLSPPAQELSDFFRQRGLHPYHLPQACEFLPDCHGCQGYLCQRDCKNDAARVCLKPAITQHGAVLLDECEVIKLEASDKEVDGVVCRRHGEILTLHADLVVLAAGALATPKILLSSVSPAWPDGLANDSGLVGKHLMRHYVDLYAVSTNANPLDSGNPKEIAFNDFYCQDGQKLGSVQSFGVLPPAPMLVAAMEQDIRNSAFSWTAAPFQLAKPVLRAFLARTFSRSIMLASILEDLPYAHNQVTVRRGNGGELAIALRYRLHAHERARIDAFRRKLAAALKPYRFMLLKQADNNQRIAHVCGTCRFGLDPDHSVLDANNKAHGLSNLYVVDASFFPSSGGTNPALTIAANALRVADHLVGPYMR